MIFKIVLFIFILIVVLVLYGLLEYYWLKTKQINIKDFKVKKDIPEQLRGKRIVFISDFQFDHRGRNFLDHAAQNVVNKTNSLEPDLVILGGDYIHQKHRRNNRIFDYLKEIEAPKVGVLGNHDYRDLETSLEGLKYANVQVIKNEVVRFHGVNIIGVDDYKRGKIKLPKYDNSLNLLVTHNPDYAPKLDSDADIDFALAGHLHGGQLTFFGLYAPAANHSEYGQRYRYGLVHDENHSIYITSGVGGTVNLIPIRIFARPEIVVIDF
ncbi:metallophosphoesterase [Erysipelothrix rhusiopathiae]|nr:metallophosphoesterase [Erysipelothrix rhusiopathiae]